jgi:co-chaperonin GroES (HSP10)
MKFKAVGNAVVIKLDEIEKKSSAGVQYPGPMQPMEHKSTSGIIVSIGDGWAKPPSMMCGENELSVQRGVPNVTVGDHVAFQNFGYSTIINLKDDEGNDYVVCPGECVCCIIEE